MKNIVLVLIVFIAFSCKRKQEIKQQEKDTLSKVHKVLNDDLDDRMKLFISEKDLDADGQIYLIRFDKIEQDTIVSISKTYMPTIINEYSFMEFKGGYYTIDSLPILIMDYKNPLGFIFYKDYLLSKDILKRYDSVVHPTKIISKIFTKEYFLENGILKTPARPRMSRNR